MPGNPLPPACDFPATYALEGGASRKQLPP